MGSRVLVEPNEFDSMVGQSVEEETDCSSAFATVLVAECMQLHRRIASRLASRVPEKGLGTEGASR